MVQDSYSGRCVRSDSTRADGAGRDVRCTCGAGTKSHAVVTSAAANTWQPQASYIPRRRRSGVLAGAFDQLKALGEGVLLGISALCSFALFFHFVVQARPSDTTRYVMYCVCVVVALLEYRASLRKRAARRR